MPILFHELFQDTCSANQMQVKSVIDFMGRTMTNLELVCHFIDSCPSVVKNQHTDLFSVCFICQCGWAP